MKKAIGLSATLALSACVATSPEPQFASPNGIALKYEAYDSVLTLTPEAREMAIQHCAKYGKHANYKGGNAVNAMVSAEEVHQFTCDATKTDDSAIIAAQSIRPTVVPVPVYSPAYVAVPVYSPGF